MATTETSKVVLGCFFVGILVLVGWMIWNYVKSPSADKIAPASCPNKKPSPLSPLPSSPSAAPSVQPAQVAAVMSPTIGEATQSKNVPLLTDLEAVNRTEKEVKMANQFPTLQELLSTPMQARVAPATTRRMFDMNPLFATPSLEPDALEAYVPMFSSEFNGRDVLASNQVARSTAQSRV